ncbi:MAG: FKBP-type peptidyl-prolyl cis-trans isomerase [Verrucomicrobiota bacterium]|jgi:FKBP-type peptidyl-prolyl cis-trans isomerase
MKQLIGILIIGWGSVGLLLADSTMLTTEQDTNSYAIGMWLGHMAARAIQQQELSVNADVLVQAAKAEITSNSTLLTDPQMQKVLADLTAQYRAKITARMAAQAATNKIEAETFLATNKDNPGVITTADGLQYRVITDGTGATPTINDSVMVNYRGTLLNGTEFDSTLKSGQPRMLQVKGVVPGWTEALLHMKVGSKWQLFIPPNLGYGQAGRPGIPQNSLLIFDLELVSVVVPPAAGPRPPSSNPPVTSDIIKVPSAEELKHGAQIEIITNK